MALQDIGVKLVVEGLDSFKSSMDAVQQKIDGVDKETQKTLQTVGLGLTAAGVAVTAFGVLSAKKYADVGSALLEMSQKTGLSVETLSELKYAAEQSGTSIDAVNVAARRMATTIYDADTGLATAKRSFEALGIPLEQLKALAPEEQFLLIAQRIASIPDPTTKAALAVDVFGRSGTELLPMLAGGAEGLDKMREKAHELGLVFSEEGARKADEFGDAMTALKSSFTGVMFTIGAGVADVLKPFIDFITGIISKISEWARENPILSQTLTVMIGTVGLLSSGIGAFLLLLPKVTAAIYAMKLAIAGMTGPVGLVIAGITALAGVLTFVFGSSGPSAVEKQIDSLKKLSAETVKIEQERYQTFLDYTEKRKVLVQEEMDAAIENVKKVYGEEKETFKSMLEVAEETHNQRLEAIDKEENAWRQLSQMQIDLQNEAADNAKRFAREATEVALKELDIRREAEQKAFDERMALIDKEYKERFKLLDQDTKAALQAIQDRIAAIDDQTQLEQRALQERRDQEQLALLQSKADREEDAEKKAALTKEINELIAEIERNRLLQAREDLKDSLREEIESIREGAADKKENLAEEYDAKKQAESDKLAASLEALDTEQERLNTALAGRLEDIDELRDKAIEAAKTTLNEKLASLDKERQREYELHTMKLKFISDQKEAAIMALQEIMRLKVAQFDVEVKVLQNQHETLLAEEADYQRKLAELRESGVLEPQPFEASKIGKFWETPEQRAEREAAVNAANELLKRGKAAPVTPEVPKTEEEIKVQEDIDAYLRSLAFYGFVPGLQHGGRVRRGGLAVVGERGPELVALPAGAVVSPLGNRVTNYNLTANYSKPQEPQAIRYDLEALMMMARR